MYRFAAGLVIVVSLAASDAGWGAEPAGFRLWRHVDGREAVLKLVGVDQADALFETEAGEIGRTPIADLSATDRQFLSSYSSTIGRESFANFQGPAASAAESGDASPGAVAALSEADLRGRLQKVNEYYKNDVEYYETLLPEQYRTTEWRSALSAGPSYDQASDSVQWHVVMPSEGPQGDSAAADGLRAIVTEILGQKLAISGDQAARYTESFQPEFRSSGAASPSTPHSSAMPPAGTTLQAEPVIASVCCGIPTAYTPCCPTPAVYGCGHIVVCQRRCFGHCVSHCGGCVRAHCRPRLFTSCCWSRCR